MRLWGHLSKKTYKHETVRTLIYTPPPQKKTKKNNNNNIQTWDCEDMNLKKLQTWDCEDMNKKTYKHETVRTFIKKTYKHETVRTWIKKTYKHETVRTWITKKNIQTWDSEDMNKKTYKHESVMTQINLNPPPPLPYTSLRPPSWFSGIIFKHTTSQKSRTLLASTLPRQSVFHIVCLLVFLS